MKLTYKGWANYETWWMHLWLSNEEASYRYWREAAKQVAQGAPKSGDLQQASERFEESPRERLAEQMWEEVLHSEKIKDSDLCTDLLFAALNEIDWAAIAQMFLNDFLPTTKPETANEPCEIAESRFPLGKTCCTPEILQALSPEQITSAIQRHVRGDWGLVDPEDAAENELALQEGFRLLSVYEDDQKTHFWIITEADRSVTTVLLPSEY